MIRFRRNAEFDRAAKAMLKQACEGLCDLKAVHFSYIDFLKKPVYVGINDRKFVYPASIYKLFVAMGVLAEVKAERLSLKQKVRVTKKNAIDTKKEVPSDKRPLLEAGQRETVRYLLDLMITRSDNTAANVLIDLVTRERINKLIRRYGWRGSEVTRKFLPRALEDPKYRAVKPTVTTTRHLAEFLYLLAVWQIVDVQSSYILTLLLRGQLDKSKIRAGLPVDALFFHKTGWYSFMRDIKKRGINSEKAGVTGDCGIVEWYRQTFVVCCIVTLPPEQGKEVLRRIGRSLPSILVD
jgi:beta-lactamase class A